MSLSILKLGGLVPWLANKLRRRKPSLEEGQAGVLATVLAWGLIVLLVLVVLRSCSDGRHEAAQVKQDVRSSAALAETAREAAATVIDQAAEEASVDELVAATIEEIENAPTDQAAGAAARHAICRLPEYRADPACRL